MNPINNNNILNFPEKDRELNTPAPEKTISTSTGSLLSGGEQSLNTSFVKLTEYSNNLRSRRSSHSPAAEKFTPGNNNQILLTPPEEMKKVSPVSLRSQGETFPQLATGAPEGETALPSGARSGPGWVGDIGHSRGENKNTPLRRGGGSPGGETTPSLITKGTKYLGGKDILTPVKSNTPERKDLSPWPGGFSGASGSHTTDLDTLRRTPETKDFSRGESFSPEKFNTEIATSQYLVYSFNNSKKKLIGNITSILKNSFYSMYSLISRPVLDITPNKITIHLFFFVSSGPGGSRRKTGKSSQYPTFPSGEKWGPPGENTPEGESSPREFSPLRGDFLNSPARSGEENHKQLQILCANLSRYLKKPVELELVRLYYPYNDSQILANTIGLLSKNIRNRFRSLVDNTFNFSQIKNPTKMITAPRSGEKNPRISILPSFLTGIKIRLGGRLLSQKVVPRFTVQTFQEGSLARTKANFVTSSRFTAKNKRGTFSITVSIGHGFF